MIFSLSSFVLLVFSLVLTLCDPLLDQAPPHWFVHLYDCLHVYDLSFGLRIWITGS